MNHAYSKRVKEIIIVFVKYGFGYLFDNKENGEKKSPSNFRKALEELGPTFIKIGQILSTRPDILPKEYIDELVKLQDSAVEESFNKMTQVLEESINLKFEDIFTYINPRPIASASIAQVYEGILYDGQNVVIKIQRPDIYNKMKDDIGILIRLFKIAKNKINISVINPFEVLAQIKSSMIKELDFRNEAYNIEKFRALNLETKYIYAPYVVNKYSSDKVLILENINGIKINMTSDLLGKGYDLKDIAEKLTLNYCKQIFEDGFFHGDPHPGNILITKDKICFIDFGIMGSINEITKEWFNKAIIAIVSKDKEKLTNCIIAIAIKEGKVNKADIYESVSYVFDMYMEASIKNIKLAVFVEEILDTARKNNLQLPGELISLMRSLIILEGVISELNPEFQIIHVVAAYINTNSRIDILTYLIKEELITNIILGSRDTFKLPSRTLDMFNKISNGKLEVKIKNSDMRSILATLKDMIKSIILGTISATLILSSSLIIINKVKPLYKDISVIGIVGYALALIIFIITMIYTKKV